MHRIPKAIIIAIVSATILLSCGTDGPSVGTSPATKKAMSQSEYASSGNAVTAVKAIEAYGIQEQKPSSRALEGISSFKFEKETDISTEYLRGLAITDPVLKAMIAELPDSLSFTVKAGSSFSYSISESGAFIYHTMDIEMEIDGKTIELEKDYDEKWIEIDGTFFDTEPLDKMLDAADDAADILTDLFDNIDKADLSWETMISGAENKFRIQLKEGEKLEAEITGILSFSISEQSFNAYINASYTEYEDGKIEETHALEASLSFSFDKPISGISELQNFEEIAKSLSDSISIKIDGVEVWKEAFLAELD
ncbi:MAG: hypothetical protein SPJ34_00635 [Candidatus Ornithospirochaeta sp.]|nr:hypothetical protein [Candidatus Ornithospirochaeta sp.]